MNKRDKVINLLVEYVLLLSDEIYDLHLLAHVNGWREERIDLGKKLRDDLVKLDINLNKKDNE